MEALLVVVPVHHLFCGCGRATFVADLARDPQPVRADGLHLGDTAIVAAGFAQIGLGAEVEMVDGADQATLLRMLAELAEQKKVFDVIVAIGHSNAEGIKIASDAFVTWDGFAKYLKPFAPRRLILVACQAGRWPAARRLFSNLPKLRRIYASPVNASRGLAGLMLILAPYVVGVRAPKKDAVTYGQIAAMGITGCQVREWKRDADKDDPAGELLDFASQALDPYVRQVPGLLRSLLGG